MGKKIVDMGRNNPHIHEVPSQMYETISLNLEAIAALDELIKREEIDEGSTEDNRSAAIIFYKNHCNILKAVVSSELDKHEKRIEALEKITEQYFKPPV